MTFTEKIAAQAGLVRSHSFVASSITTGFGGDIAYFINAGQTNPTSAVIDSSILASGQSSLKFTIPSQSGSGSSGQWTMRFASDNSVQFGAGETFYAQFMQKFDRYFFEHTFTGGGGWKQSILGSADDTGCTVPGTAPPCATSCTNLEVVLQNTLQRNIVQMYNSCGTFAPFSVGPINGSDFDLQPYQGLTPGVGTYCSYQGLPGTTNCRTYTEGLASGGDQVTRWGTFTVRISLGAVSGGHFVGSNVQAWVSWTGSAAQQFFNYDVDLVASGSEKYGRIWLLPYHTSKDDTEVHTETYTWYANPIIATSAIPLTTDEVASGSLALVLR